MKGNEYVSIVVVLDHCVVDFKIQKNYPLQVNKVAVRIGTVMKPGLIKQKPFQTSWPYTIPIVQVYSQVDFSTIVEILNHAIDAIPQQKLVICWVFLQLENVKDLDFQNFQHSKVVVKLEIFPLILLTIKVVFGLNNI